MLLKVWSNFYKDKKSTKQPNQTDAREVEITLKENTSVINPTFILRWDMTPEFNYCQWIAAFYYVEDVTIRSKDVYEIRCSMDRLASYRGDILASTQFVLRSASQYNLNLRDSEIAPAFNVTKTVLNTNCALLSGSTYLLRVMGKGSAGSPYGINTFVATQQGIQGIIDAAFNNAAFNTTTFGLDELLALLKCIFFDPSQYILSVNWLPVDINPSGGQESIYLGWYQTGWTARLLEDIGTYQHIAISTPSRVYNDFRDFDENFTRFLLSIPCVGVVSLNPNDVYAGLSVAVTVEYLTGDVTYYIYNTTTSACVGKYRTNVNCSIQIGGVNNAINGSSIVSGITSAVTELSAPHANIIGNVGSQMEILNDHEFRLTRIVQGSAESPYLNKGKPLNQYKVLNTLSGFTQCQNAILSSGAYGQVKEEIESAMNSGFIIE